MAVVLLVGACLLAPAALAAYPVFAWLRCRLRPKPVSPAERALPPVSILIAAHNEAEYIGAKLSSFLAASEWIPGSEIIVVSGGSTDATEQVLADFDHDPRVRVHATPEPLTKIDALNRAIAWAQHPVLVFSDCRQAMQPGSVRALIRPFSDPEIGTVAATLQSGSSGRSLRQLLNFVAHCESVSGSCLNVFGALYAQRRAVFRPFPGHILFDDLFVVASTLAQGYRLIMVPDAVLVDVPFERYYRKDRVERLARGLWLFLVRETRLIARMPPLLLLRFLVFKYAKLIIPWSLLGLLAIAVAAHWWGALMGAGAIVGLAMLIPAVRPPFMHLIRVQIHFISATLKFFLGRDRRVGWQKIDGYPPVQTPRP